MQYIVYRAEVDLASGGPELQTGRLLWREVAAISGPSQILSFVDSTVEIGKTYLWRIAVRDIEGNESPAQANTQVTLRRHLGNTVELEGKVKLGYQLPETDVPVWVYAMDPVADTVDGNGYTDKWVLLDDPTLTDGEEQARVTFYERLYRLYVQDTEIGRLPIASAIAHGGDGSDHNVPAAPITVDDKIIDYFSFPSTWREWSSERGQNLPENYYAHERAGTPGEALISLPHIATVTVDFANLNSGVDFVEVKIGSESTYLVAGVDFAIDTDSDTTAEHLKDAMLALGVTATRLVDKVTAYNLPEVLKLRTGKIVGSDYVISTPYKLDIGLDNSLLEEGDKLTITIGSNETIVTAVNDTPGDGEFVIGSTAEESLRNILSVLLGKFTTDEVFVKFTGWSVLLKAQSINPDDNTVETGTAWDLDETLADTPLGLSVANDVLNTSDLLTKTLDIYDRTFTFVSEITAAHQILVHPNRQLTLASICEALHQESLPILLDATNQSIKIIEDISAGPSEVATNSTVLLASTDTGTVKQIQDTDLREYGEGSGKFGQSAGHIHLRVDWQEVNEPGFSRGVVLVNNRFYAGYVPNRSSYVEDYLVRPSKHIPIAADGVTATRIEVRKYHVLGHYISKVLYKICPKRAVLPTLLKDNIKLRADYINSVLGIKVDLQDRYTPQHLLSLPAFLDWRILDQDLEDAAPLLDDTVTSPVVAKPITRDAWAMLAGGVTQAREGVLSTTVKLYDGWGLNEFGVLTDTILRGNASPWSPLVFISSLSGPGWALSMEIDTVQFTIGSQQELYNKQGAPYSLSKREDVVVSHPTEVVAGQLYASGEYEDNQVTTPGLDFPEGLTHTVTDLVVDDLASDVETSVFVPSTVLCACPNLFEEQIVVEQETKSITLQPGEYRVEYCWGTIEGKPDVSVLMYTSFPAPLWDIRYFSFKHLREAISTRVGLPKTVPLVVQEATTYYFATPEVGQIGIKIVGVGNYYRVTERPELPMVINNYTDWPDADEDVETEWNMLEWHDADRVYDEEEETGIRNTVFPEMRIFEQNRDGVGSPGLLQVVVSSPKIDSINIMPDALNSSMITHYTGNPMEVAPTFILEVPGLVPIFPIDFSKERSGWGNNLSIVGTVRAKVDDARFAPLGLCRGIELDPGKLPSGHGDISIFSPDVSKFPWDKIEQIAVASNRDDVKLLWHTEAGIPISIPMRRDGSSYVVSNTTKISHLPAPVRLSLQFWGYSSAQDVKVMGTRHIYGVWFSQKVYDWWATCKRRLIGEFSWADWDGGLGTITGKIPDTGQKLTTTGPRQIRGSAFPTGYEYLITLWAQNDAAAAPQDSGNNLLHELQENKPPRAIDVHLIVQ